MTAQCVEDISNIEGLCKGKGVWIAGSGVTLDDHDLSKLDGQVVISLNATILRMLDLAADVWWLYYDKRMFTEIRERLFSLKPKMMQAMINKVGVSQMREYRGAARYFAYAGFHPSRTVLETALMIAEFLGFSEAYLIGIDGFVGNDRGRFYCEGLEWKEVRFAKKGKAGSHKASSRDCMAALSELDLNLDVYRASSLFPSDGPFKEATFDECLERSSAINKTPISLKSTAAL